jgi:hypothetical protein
MKIKNFFEALRNFGARAVGASSSFDKVRTYNPGI